MESHKQEETKTLCLRPRLTPAPLLGRITAEGSVIQPGCSSVGLNLKCVCVCVMYYISSWVAFLTGWPCRTCTALDALKSPCGAARACVTDNQGAAVAARRTSSAGIRQWFKVVHVLSSCQLYFWDHTDGLAAHKFLEGQSKRCRGLAF